jgi:hypothetical protein
MTPENTGRSRGPEQSLFEATSVVGGMTLLSRVTGLARDIAFSAWFGAGPVMDAFAVAFKIPNLLRRFFAEGAFSQAFVPVISEYRTHKSHAETRELVSHVAVETLDDGTEPNLQDLRDMDSSQYYINRRGLALYTFIMGGTMNDIGPNDSDFTAIHSPGMIQWIADATSRTSQFSEEQDE